MKIPDIDLNCFFRILTITEITIPCTYTNNNTQAGYYKYVCWYVGLWKTRYTCKFLYTLKWSTKIKLFQSRNQTKSINFFKYFFPYILNTYMYKIIMRCKPKLINLNNLKQEKAFVNWMNKNTANIICLHMDKSTSSIFYIEVYYIFRFPEFSFTWNAKKFFNHNLYWRV